MNNEIQFDPATINMNSIRQGFDLSVGDITYTCHALKENDLTALLKLQTYVHETLPDKDQFVYTTAEECSDSLQNDLVIGLYHETDLAAACILVINRDSDRNIGRKMGFEPKKCLTLDSVFIAPEYRGQGLQRFLIKIMLSLANELCAEKAFATVAPENTYSLDNFQKMGFEVFYKGTMYGSIERYVLIRSLP